MPPTLSVVIPTRDTRDLTLAALAAVTGQSAPPFEVVVVDDGGDDGTDTAVGTRFPAVRIMRTGGVGFSGAANAGVAATAGDLIWLLNSDTEADVRAAERIVAEFEGDAGLGVGGASLVYPDGTPQWSGGRFPTLPWLLGEASGLPALLGRSSMWRAVRPVSGAVGGPVDWVTGAAMVVRRDVWQRCGPFSEAYEFYGQDLELCWQAREAGWAVRVLPDVRVVHHHGATVAGDRPTAVRAHLPVLWRDLVRFEHRRRGPRAGMWAARVMRTGAGARLLVRGTAAGLVPRAQRARWDADTRTLRDAVRGLSGLGPPVDTGRADGR